MIPVYNGEAYLERTLLSAAAQTYPNTKIVVIDDGSKDGSPGILARLGPRIPNMEVHRVPNGGVARARNTGTEIAGTDYVAYLDADDLWHPTKIEKQMATLLAHEGDPSWAACYTLYRKIDANDLHVSNGPSPEIRGAFFASHLVQNHVGNGSSLLVRRDVALAVGGFEPSYAAEGAGGCEDRDFQLRLLRRHKMDVTREFLVGYRVTPGNMSSNHVAMGRGQIAVCDRFSRDPQVPARLRTLAMMSAHGYSCRQFTRARNWPLIRASYGYQFRAAPLATLGRMGHIFWRAALRRAGRLWPAAKPAKTPRRHFSEIDPTEGVVPAGAAPKPRHVLRLAAFDRAFHAQPQGGAQRDPA